MAAALAVAACSAQFDEVDDSSARHEADADFLVGGDQDLDGGAPATGDLGVAGTSGSPGVDFSSGGDGIAAAGAGGTASDDAGTPGGDGSVDGNPSASVVTPIAPSEDFLFASDFSTKDESHVPPWKLISFQHPGVKMHGWTRSPKTDATTNCVGQFDFRSQGVVGAASIEDAVASERYAAVAFEPNFIGLTFNLNGATVSFAVNRSASSGAGDIAVLSSVEGFNANKVLFVAKPGVSSANPIDLYTFTLPASGYDGLGGVIEFRFYALGSVGSKAESAIRAFWIGGSARNDALTRTPKRRDVGTNLAEAKEYGTDSPFLDKFKLARRWFTNKVGDPVKQYESTLAKQIPRDADGWPTKVPFTVPGVDEPRYVHTIVRLPYNGKWALMYKGRGTIRLTGPVTETITAQGGQGRRDILINKPDIGFGTIPELKFIAAATLFLEILESEEGDPVRDIRVVHHGHLTTYESQVFEPALLARLHGFSPIRFLKWSNTNLTRDSEWSERTTTTSYSQAEDDVAWEYVIALLNATKSDGWITLPHLATEDYLTKVATLFKQTLDPNLKLYVEFSNETWNNGYLSAQWITEQETKSPLNREEFATRQQVRVWEAFQDVFGNEFETRIKRPLGGWATNNGRNRARLGALNNTSVNPRGIKAQGLAVAPYFGKAYRKEALDNGVPTVEKLLDEAAGDLNYKRSRSFVDLKKTAQDFDVELWAAEGGQHIVADQSPAREVAELVTNVTLASRHERMGDIYRSYMSFLHEAGFSLFVQFAFVEASSKFGAWGSLENLDQNPATAPKFRVIEQAIFGP